MDDQNNEVTVSVTTTTTTDGDEVVKTTTTTTTEEVVETTPATDNGVVATEDVETVVSTQEIVIEVPVDGGDGNKKAEDAKPEPAADAPEANVEAPTAPVKEENDVKGKLLYSLMASFKNNLTFSKHSIRNIFAKF